jgi:hypothetical protein
MSSRPTSPKDNLCLYDHKLWGTEPIPEPIGSHDSAPELLACLYLTSQLGDLAAILEMAHGGQPPDVVIYTDTLDLDIRAVVESPRRFRNALSEHLAFWTRLATHVQTVDDTKFACSLPNFQPEDKGPDGLFASHGDLLKIEVHEVKNSSGHPGSRIANNDFRAKGGVSEPRTGKKTGLLLVDFWLFENGIVGFHRLDRLLSQILNMLNLPADQILRAGLLPSCTYNAVVVADDRYGDIGLFRGYEHVTKQIERRIATYIGATSWGELAEQSRQVAAQTLAKLGVW